MRIIQSEFIVKGYKNGNSYYITKNINGNFNIYQLFCDVNKDKKVDDIKNILPDLKHLSDDEIIVSFPKEHYHAFLLLYNVNIYKMNKFRITLTNENIIKK